MIETSGPLDPVFQEALADALEFVIPELQKIGRNGDLVLSPDEVINAVKDVYDAPGASTDFFDFDDVGTVASALDAMNNMPHIDASEFDHMI